MIFRHFRILIIVVITKVYGNNKPPPPPLLVLCPALVKCRQNAFNMLEQKENFSDSCKKLIHEVYNTSVNDFVQLLLDCSVIPKQSVESWDR